MATLTHDWLAESTGGGTLLRVKELEQQQQEQACPSCASGPLVLPARTAQAERCPAGR